MAKHKIPLAIATGSRQTNFITKTTHLPELFSHFPSVHVITGDNAEVKRGKPHPDIFLKAAETLGIETTEEHAKCLV